MWYFFGGKIFSFLLMPSVSSCQFLRTNTFNTGDWECVCDGFVGDFLLYFRRSTQPAHTWTILCIIIWIYQAIKYY